MAAKTYLNAKLVGVAMIGAAAILGAGVGLAQTPAAPAPSAAPAVDMTAAKATMEAICSNCHDIAIVTEARYRRADWQNVITRMQSYGLPATPEETKQILDYLSVTYPAP